MIRAPRIRSLGRGWLWPPVLMGAQSTMVLMGAQSTMVLMGAQSTSAAPLAKRPHRSGESTQEGRRLTLQGSTLRGSTLQGSTLQGSTLQGSTLQGSTLQGSTLQGITLQGSTLQGSTLQGSTLQWLTFSDGTTEWRSEDEKAMARLGSSYRAILCVVKEKCCHNVS